MNEIRSFVNSFLARSEMNEWTKFVPSVIRSWAQERITNERNSFRSSNEMNEQRNSSFVPGIQERNERISFIRYSFPGRNEIRSRQGTNWTKWMNFVHFVPAWTKWTKWTNFVPACHERNELKERNSFLPPARGPHERITKFVPFVPGFRNEMNEIRSWFSIRSWIWTNSGNGIRYSFLGFRNEWNEIRSCRNEFVNEFVQFVNEFKFANEFRHRGG